MQITRKEVLLAEAMVKPRQGKNCSLTGGKWRSAYDGKMHLSHRLGRGRAPLEADRAEAKALRSIVVGCKSATGRFTPAL
ncbi:hypothetical protein DY245_42035 [Streptomyces inhibens]|uniref:Uncharacterized protein n=1 Tax=Streptomyces inhibens TaxID=2293571 RepID=A0A371PQ59_STRIH|nr:hypothetical protein DY245_42035 [Streptomyces inhibens]